MSGELGSPGALILLTFVLAVGCGSDSETSVGSPHGGAAGTSNATVTGGTGEVTAGGMAGEAGTAEGSGGAAGSAGGTDGGTGGDLGSGGTGTGGTGTGGDPGSGGAPPGSGGDGIGGDVTGSGGDGTGGSGTGGNGTGGDGSGGDGTGGDAGSAETGTGGDPGSGGTGTGGDPSTGGTGMGGDPGSGGSGAATGGTGGQWPACESESDCALISTCCTCMVAPVGTPEPEGCTILCETDLCTVHGFSQDDVACQHGFCSVEGSDGRCNAEDVTCASSPPPCPSGYLPSVVDGCWGPCVLENSCLSTG